MATNPAQPPVPPAPADHHFDEKTGIYGFFRRNQKRLLYSVGLFTLLTFSVSGPMLATVGEMFTDPQPMPTIEVGGQRVSMQREDYLYGQQIARALGALYTVVPPVDAGEGGQTDLGDVYALLRRVAITEGFDASYDEVDRAIEVMREKSKIASATQLARQRGFASLAEFRGLLREAMRIGQMMRLQTLVLDNSDAAVLQQVLADKEKITFKVASFDEKALEESLKKAGGLTDDDLRKWLDGKNEAEKNRIGVYDTNRVELKIGAAMHADFDAAQWQDEALKDFKVADEQLKRTYEQEKDARFKQENGKDYKPLEDEAVKAELTKLLQLDQVMNHLLGKLREQQNEAMKAANDELRKTNEAWSTAQNNVTASTEKLGVAKQKLSEKPADPELTAEVAKLQEEVRLAQEVVPAMENAKKEAEEAVKAARAAFDFPAKFAELTKDKKGFVQKALTGKRNAEALKDLEANDVGLGQWSLAMYATFLQNKGDLSQQPGRTTKATILFQASDIEVRPLKPWETLKPLLEGAYYTEKAKTEAEAKKKIMEESLLRLAKAKMPDKVAEIEGKRQKTVDDKLAEWEKITTADLAKAGENVAELPADTQAHAAWVRKRDALKDQLAKKEERRKAIDQEVGKQIEQEIADEAKKHHADVLAGAAADAGFTVVELPPYSRELAQKPRFDKNFDPTVVFLFQNHSDMKAGESTGMVQDSTNRRWVVASCTKVEPLTAADVDRREFESLRKGYGYTSYASLRSMMALSQAFSRSALETRYRFQSAIGEQKKPETPKTPETPK
jgi:hypothetical protein